MAERAGVKASWLSAVKNDRIKDRPNLEDLAAVAKVCGVPVGYLTEPLGFVPVDSIEHPDWELAIRRNTSFSERDKDILIRVGRSLERAERGAEESVGSL